MPSPSLRNPQSVLITGANGALGQALALGYAASGVRLILHGRNEDALNALAVRCRAQHATAFVVLHDLGSVEGFEASIAAAARRYEVTLLIVNAGITSTPAAQEDEASSVISRVIEINLLAAIMSAQAVIPLFRERGRGQIALISSVSAYFGLAITPAYCASKAGLKAYGEALRGRLACENIAVSIVLPGFFESAMSDQFHSPKPFMLSPEIAAHKIIQGLARNKACISFPLRLVVAMRTLAILPTDLSIYILNKFGFGRR